MSNERDFLKGGEGKREEPVGTHKDSEYPPKRAEEEDSVNVEEAPGCSGTLRYAEVNLDPALLELVVDEEKCRSIRKHYRQLIHNVQQQRDDIVNTANESLTEALEEANVLFDEVSRPREAALDAHFLVLASDLGKEKAKRLNCNGSSFNPGLFCDFLFMFAGLNWLEAKHEDLGNCDERTTLSFWKKIQKKATSWTLRAETFHFISGSFKSAPSAPKPRQRRRVHSVEERVDMPTKLRRMDLNGNHEATEKEVERILGLLQTYFRKYPDSPISYFEFVTDPHSFSRTVENIFHVSFIIRDGFARISLDQDRLPILEPVNASRMYERCDTGSDGRKQGIISLSLQEWKNIVATFEISEAMIKHEK